ncbi:hypothetical protein [Aurantiacibacter spongiae]|uniref:Uncharacterized protein n=1 Tax=Aurantiacibacter spongiae TaxID=2488860 RepID=A0A3N5D7G0_9SPHN|nr:hypothetical protein [Aurantiacibacter spongiae]RPF70468.1 hypothetical protein EG799_01600 [Aurantiacibacter spongiae]
MSDKHVRPNSKRLTDADARHLLADGLLRACHRDGPSRVALETGCDEKTIRRARDEETTLKLGCAWNLLDVDVHALDAIAAAKGVMIVPLMDAADDIIASAGAAIHRIGQNRAAGSDGGSSETDRELIDSEAENDALLAACLERRSRISQAKLRRAA